MGGKKNKNKKKKINPKKERYAKFRKDKPGTADFSVPDLSDDQRKQAKTDEEQIERFLRFNRNPPTKEVVERRMKDKR